MTARKFRDLQAMSNEAELPTVGPVEQAARGLQAEEIRLEGNGETHAGP